MTRNLFHSLGDILAVAITRVCAAWLELHPGFAATWPTLASRLPAHG